MEKREIAEKSEGKFQWLDMARLEIDSSYQRTLISQKTITEIVRNFEWKKFGTVSVAKRGEKMFIVDGQHRFLAAKELKLIRIPCFVYESKGRKEEAEIFLGVNSGRVPVSAIDKFHAAVTSGSKFHIEVKNMLERNGLRARISKEQNSINFIHRVIEAFRTDEEMCESAIAFAKEVANGEYIYDVVFCGAFYLLSNGIDVWEHIDRVNVAGGSLAVVKAANAVVALSGIKERGVRACGVGLLNVINKRKRYKLRLQE